MQRSIFISVLLAIVIFQILGEKVPIHEGAYGDGLFYREVAVSFLDQIEDESYNIIQIQRLLPFAMVNMIFSLFGFDHDYDSLMSGMLIFHFLMLTPGIYWYFSLGKKMRLRSSLIFLGFVLLFVNFAILKETWYNPFSTDFTGLILGIGQVNYFVRHERQKLFLVSIIGGFVSPTLLLTGLILIFLPSDFMQMHEGERPKSLFPVLASAVLLFLLIMVSAFTGRFATGETWDIVLHKLSLLAMVAFVFVFMFKNTIQWKESWQLFRKKLKSQKAIRLMTILLAFVFIVFLLSGSNQNIHIESLAQAYFGDMLRYPLDFLVGHLLYFGFLIPLSLVFFPRMIKEMAKLGMGFTVLCLIFFVLLLNPESRLLMPFIPFLVFLLLKAVRTYRILDKDLYVVGGLNILLSTFWLPLNVNEMSASLMSVQKEVINAFPAQRYWMHFGDMMSFPVYFVGGILFCLLVYVAYRGKSRYIRLRKEES
ncbi:hypothetical protein [Aquiflexum lacus]|uniref:hypothetical protein n=1 Tax=Aquiflexum lacus TaxID=2483805 RepID=UPI001E589146|nr:hypothetical protein [Aquiflexum lacus]